MYTFFEVFFKSSFKIVFIFCFCSRLLEVHYSLPYITVTFCLRVAPPGLFMSSLMEVLKF